MVNPLLTRVYDKTVDNFTTDLLEEEGFVKVHRSYLVNEDHVVRIKHRIAFMDNGKEVPISKYRVKDVKERLTGK